MKVLQQLAALVSAGLPIFWNGCTLLTYRRRLTDNKDVYDMQEWKAGLYRISKGSSNVITSHGNMQQDLDSVANLGQRQIQSLDCLFTFVMWP